MTHAIRGEAVLFTAGLLAGCSWTFVTPPPGRSAPTESTRDEPPCMSSQSAPIADTVFASVGATAVAFGVGWSAWAGVEEQLFLGTVVGIPLLVVGLGILVPFALSASSGFEDVEQCREVLADLPCGGAAARCIDDLYEDNDDPGSATSIQSILSGDRFIVTDNDPDWWALDVCPAALVRLNIRFEDWDDTAGIQLEDAAGAVLSRPDVSGFNPVLEWVSDRVGTVYVHVAGRPRSVTESTFGGPDGSDPASDAPCRPVAVEHTCLAYRIDGGVGRSSCHPAAGAPL